MGGGGGGGIPTDFFFFFYYLFFFFFFYYLFESKILASAGSPIITQLVHLFFAGEPFYFATNLKKVSVVFF